MSEGIEQEIDLPVDTSGVEDAIRAFGRADESLEAFLGTAARGLGSSLGNLLMGAVEGFREYAAAASQAAGADGQAGAEYDAHVRSHVEEQKRWMGVTKQMDAAVAAFAGGLGKVPPTARASGAGLRDMTGSLQVMGNSALEVAQGGLDKLERGLDSTKNAAMSFARDVASTALGFGLAGQVGSLIHSLVELPSKVLEASAGAERIDNALHFSLGPDAGGVLDWLETIASKTQFSEDQLKGFALTMTKVGIPVKDLDKDMAAALDITAKNGGGLEEMTGVINAFAEAARRGSVNMRVLRPLGLGPEALSVLPEFAGLTDKELKKQIDQGNLTAGQLRRVIAGADGVIGDIGIKGGNDMETKLKNLRDLPDLLFQQFASNPAFDVLKGKMDELYQFFAPGGPGGEAIIAFIGKTGAAAVDWLKGIDFDEVASDLDDWLGIFSEIGSVAKFLFGVIADTARLVKTIVHDLTPIGFLMDQVGDFHAGTADIRQQNKAIAEHARSFAPDKFQRVSDADLPDDEELSFLKKSDRSPRVARQVIGPSTGHTVNVQLHTTVHAGAAGDPTEVAEAVSQHVGKMMPGTLLGALQQANAQAGH
jgi:tape measure domain-containing protein